MLVIYILLIVITVVYFYCKHKQNYWQSRGINVPPYAPIIGHVFKLNFNSCPWIYLEKVYHQNKQNRLWGMYETVVPRIYIRDLELIRCIMVKDADYFIDRHTFKFNGKSEIFNEMLTILQGEKWKALRSIITPTFTSGKIKGMFHLVENKGDYLVEKCQRDMTKDSFVEMKQTFGFYTMDVIASCAFGIEAHCLQKGETEFFKHAGRLSNFSIKQMILIVIGTIVPFFFKICSDIGTKDSITFFEEAILHTVKVRKESGNKRGDFLDIIMEALQELEHREDAKYPMTMKTVISESLLFLLAGFETTSNTLTFLSFLLAKNPECQNLLREELSRIINNDGELNYQNLMEAKYLDACMSETLRMYTILHVLERLCVRSYRIPETDLEIPKGTMVAIPAWSLHYDTEYWDEPKKFKPERFLPENKDKITPYSYMPFGLGPRNCIGMRFAQMETKIAIAKLCLNFEISLSVENQELKLDNHIKSIKPSKEGLKLILKKIEK